MVALKMKPRPITPEEYQAHEELATEKNEYFDGQVFAMAGGSHNHDMICGNMYTALRQFARARGCTAYTSNMRLLVNVNGLYTYPDAMIVCGPVQFSPGRNDTVTNHLLLVEVLSDSTEHYDRGNKFELYRGIATFAYYILIHQDRVFIELHQRVSAGWLLTEIKDINVTLKFDALDLEIPVSAIYEDVNWALNL